MCESEALARKVAHLSDSIKLQSINQDIRGQHVAFLASFSSPSVIFEQLSIIFALPRLFVASFTLVLPFFPTGSFEHMEEEGDVATAFTMARILSNIPISRGGPTSLVIYDIHALQIVCNKVREGDKRIVRLKEGNPAAHHVVIVDDLKVVFKTRGDLDNALAEAEEEVVNIATALGENTLSLFFKLEKRDGTPKDQLPSIKQTLKELQHKREERMKEFVDIQSQIIQVHEVLRSSVVDGQIVDDKDLTTKRLRELKLVLQGLQSEKAARSAGVPVILDARGMDGLIPVDLLRNVNIFSPNETELERLMRMPTKSFEQICQSVAKIHEMTSCYGDDMNHSFLVFSITILASGKKDAVHGVVALHALNLIPLLDSLQQDTFFWLEQEEENKRPRKRNPRFVPVNLNVYDLHPINGSIYWLGLGLYHSGIQVHGVEYEFRGHDTPSTGIFRGKPRECPGLTFRKSILIGRTDLGPHEVHKFMEDLSKSYTGTSYNLITKNCNHFWNDVSEAKLRVISDSRNISIAFPDEGAWKRFYKQLQHFPMFEKRDGTPTDQLSSIKQTLKDLQRKRE
ncbi:hypothetical protein Sjap_004918 [Stephania japonica]|uniref:PPPDE domain-containing protein n=1 Tax=Stephania japonica TaxID=461633 RepID=A0AAP0PKN4_9MAGN